MPPSTTIYGPAVGPPTGRYTRALRARDGNRRGEGRAAASAKPPGPEPPVIVLSSDSEDDDVAHLAKVPLKRKKKSTGDENTPNGNAGSSKGLSRVGSSVMEVTMTVPPPKAESTGATQLRREIEKLKQELLVERRAKAALQTELAESKAQKAKGKEVDLVSDLEDCTVCEICTKRMWSPATLVECGHTFCQSCLRGWFDTVYTKHIQQHPEYLAGPQIPVHLLAQQQHHLIARQAVRELQELYMQRVPQPSYTCPACRVAVKMKPVEMFALKEVVEKVAKAAGEEVEEAQAQNRAVRADIGGIWDGFFKS